MKHSAFVRISAVVAFLTILLCIPMRASAYPTTHSINLPSVVQEKSNWCWAACSCAIIEYYGGNVDQEDFVYSVLGNTNNKGVDMPEIQRGLSNYSIGSTYIKDTLTLEQIRVGTYNSRRPIIAGWQYRNTSSIISSRKGHVVVVTGYIDDSNLQERCVIYMDPETGRFHTMDYSDFVKNEKTKWIRTLKDIH